MPLLREKSERLTGYLAHLLGDLSEERIRLLTPQEPAARGCQLSYQIPRGGRELFDELRRRNIVGDFRAPDVIRLSPAPLYNTFHEVWRVAGAMREIVSTA